jgi:AraC-like DNA-binding protein
MATATGTQYTAGLLHRPLSEWPASIRFSTDDLPEADRLPFFREVWSRQIMRQDIDPLPGHPFQTDALMRRLPGLLVYWTTSSPRHIRRTRVLLSDGNDNLLFQCSSGARQIEHLGRETFVGPGKGIVFSCAEPRSLLVDSDFRSVSLSIPRKALGVMLRDPDASLARALPSGSGAQQLLLRYLRLLRRESSTSSPELREAAIHHVYDLLAIALGATRDAAEMAKNRGVRAARLKAAKDFIRENLLNTSLSEAWIAVCLKVSPRYVQMLFESEGTTFSAFVREQRFARVHYMLTSPRFCGRKIADIAFSCGFGDVSYFNRKFRERYSASPREVRDEWLRRGCDS